MEQPRVGFALTGSFCTLDKALLAMEETAAAYPNIVPILSETTGSTDTRFGRGADFRQAAEEICGHRAVESIRAAEPIAPSSCWMCWSSPPAPGTPWPKLAAGIADTAVTMAAKAHLRNGRPVVVAVSTNDGLGGAARNIGELLSRKHYYFVPFRQDDPVGKPTSLVAEMGLVTATVAAALRGGADTAPAAGAGGGVSIPLPELAWGACQDWRRSRPATWVPARLRAGSPAFSGESRRKRAPGAVPPGPPVLWPARSRSLVLAVVAHCSGGWAITAPICVPLIWEFSFAKCFFSIFFTRKCVPNRF